MRVKILTAMWDDKAKHFSQAVGTTMTAEEAMRAFQGTVNNPGNVVSDHPHDFHLYKLGEYDIFTGKLLALETPEILISGKDVLTNSKEGNIETS